VPQRPHAGRARTSERLLSLSRLVEPVLQLDERAAVARRERVLDRDDRVAPHQPAAAAARPPARARRKEEEADGATSASR